jgi:transcriptional regulator with XRE-family HTH domain
LAILLVVNIVQPQVTVAPAPSDFAALLRDWRRMRGMSQLSLALAAHVSTRHLGFLEVGRSNPSRAMVLALAQALEMPLRDRNQLLVVAGFAPMFRETPLADDALESVREALAFMLSSAEPCPCFVVNRRYDVMMAIGAGRWMLATFTEDPTLSDVDCNMMHVLTHPRGMGRFIANREDVLRKVAGRLKRDLGHSHRRDDADEAALARADAALASLPDAPQSNLSPIPMIGLHLARGALHLDLFTTIATLGTPLDITLQEIRIETFFPMNEATRLALAAASANAAGRIG